MTGLRTVTALLIAFCFVTGTLGNGGKKGGERKYLAKCMLVPSTGLVAVNGTIHLEQHEDKDEVELKVDIFGILPVSTLHGFHVHAVGKITNVCKDAGGHFNPHSKLHGGPMAAERHVGDLGNIQVTALGTFKDEIKDSKISLKEKVSNTANPNYIVGKAIVVHQGQDDLGLGNETDSTTTGHAGSRIGCCVIELVSKPPIQGVSTISACVGLIIAMLLLAFKF